MIPIESNNEDFESTGEKVENLSQFGQIPEDLMRSILAEAGNYMTLYNVNPSTFLQR